MCADDSAGLEKFFDFAARRITGHASLRHLLFHSGHEKKEQCGGQHYGGKVLKNAMVHASRGTEN
jgi:hypothetical protein